MDVSDDSLAEVNIEENISEVDVVDSCKITVIQEMDDSGDSQEGGKFEESTTEVDLVDAAFGYLTESRYPRRCTEARKGAIQKKASMLVVKDGVLFSRKRR